MSLAICPSSNARAHVASAVLAMNSTISPGETTEAVARDFASASTNCADSLLCFGNSFRLSAAVPQSAACKQRQLAEHPETIAVAMVLPIRWDDQASSDPKYQTPMRSKAAAITRSTVRSTEATQRLWAASSEANVRARPICLHLATLATECPAGSTRAQALRRAGDSD